MLRDYILFIDTETSGLPKNWKAPYSVAGNWPYNVQIAWVLFDKSGNEIKSENHYIKATDFQIDPKAITIHGITEPFLNEFGVERQTVFQTLANDIAKYRPLVVGHFIEFDNHMIALGFKRTGIENNYAELPHFCTMKASRRYAYSLFQSPALRLDELYKFLFKRNLKGHHDAFVDAKATGECFFEMLNRGDIKESELSGDIDRPAVRAFQGRTIWWVFALLVVLGLAIIGLNFFLKIGG